MSPAMMPANNEMTENGLKPVGQIKKYRLFSFLYYDTTDFLCRLFKVNDLLNPKNPVPGLICLSNLAVVFSNRLTCK
jgi:hypothetical protein